MKIYIVSIYWKRDGVTTSYGAWKELSAADAELKRYYEYSLEEYFDVIEDADSSDEEKVAYYPSEGFYIDQVAEAHIQEFDLI